MLNCSYIAITLSLLLLLGAGSSNFQVTKTFVKTIGLLDDPSGLEFVINQFIKGVKDQGSKRTKKETEIISKVEKLLLTENGTTPFSFASSQRCTDMLVYGSE